MFKNGDSPWNKNKSGLSNRKQPKKSAFTKGYTPWNKGTEVSWNTAKTNTTYERMESNEYDLVVKPRMDGILLTTPDCEGNSRPMCILRPKKTPTVDLKTEIKNNSFDGMSIVDNEKLITMMNSAVHLHAIKSEPCGPPSFAYYNIQKWGVCLKFQVYCERCQFITPMYKLYKTIPSEKPGPDPAAANVGFALGIQETAIGNTRAQQLLSNMNCQPPSRSSMQRTSNKVSDKLVELNQDDMADKLEIVKAVNRKRGAPENEINLTVDVRYSSNTITSKKKPGQNANQACAVGIETVTDRKYIVATASLNQMCWTGAWLRGKGFTIECPNGHEECTADLHRAAPLSEYELGKKIGNQLAVQGILVKYATTDGDGRTANGINDAIQALHPMWKVERLADPIHLGNGQFRAAMRANFSDSMFGCRTKEQKKIIQKLFSQDIKARSSLITSHLMEVYGRDIQKISEDLPKAFEATMSRNMKGRLAATVHRSNNSPGKSTKMKCDRLGIELSGRTNAFLDSTDRECAYQKEYQKREEVQHRKLSQKAENLVVHKTFKELNKANICDVYKKGQLDPVLDDHASCVKKRL
ncbi:unnamed protein product [Mytilus coruscus]|uniref:Mutator-like transposase domain-containing protein n=1 Tax=Mytilus coruscus TaxID=42192 RepID=A0A6J8EG53_MYTCO|nr:unnamed protein product [Mytilus coruscus]